MGVYPGFIGGSATVRSRNVNAEQTVNWYVERPPGTAKVSEWLAPTPGLAPFAVLSAGPVRGLIAVNGRVFAVGGSGFYEVFANATTIYWGPVASNAQPASLSTNGTNGFQVFIVSGGLGYIFDLQTNTLSQIVAAGFPSPCVMGAFSDGYFLALKGQSNQFHISDLYDGTAWDALDVFQVSTVAEQLVTLIESHREIWLLGEQTSSVWANTGDADTVYQPIGGVKIDMGSAAPFGAARIDNAIMWVGQSELGTRMVYRANGYTPQRVSTHAVEYALRREAVPRIIDAVAWAYQQEGHSFYLLYLPEADTTWAYDVATGLWHERALWDDVYLRWRPHPGRCACFGFGRHLVGDRSSGAIYDMRLDLGSDTLVEPA